MFDDFFKNIPDNVTTEIIFLSFILLLREALGFVRLYFDSQRLKKGAGVATDLGEIAKTLDVRTQQMAARSDKYEQILPKILDEIQSLYDMHQVRDSNGYPIWYQNPAQMTVLTKIAESMEKQGNVLIQIGHTLEIQNKDLLLAINGVNISIATLQSEVKQLQKGR